MNGMATNIEQSKRLAELGMDRKISDLFYKQNHGMTKIYTYLESEWTDDCIPAWSVSAMMLYLPSGTRVLKAAHGNSYYCDSLNDNVFYRDYGPRKNSNIWYDSVIDALFDYLEWILGGQKEESNENR